MRKVSFLMILVILLSGACGSQPAPTPTAEQPISIPTAKQPRAVPTEGAMAEQATEVLPSLTIEPATDTPRPTDVPTPALAVTDTPVSPTAVPLPTEASEPVEFPGSPLPTDRSDRVSASGACAVCHTQMTDEAGNDVSTDTFWRASMMANAARDPYWLASVEGEVLSHPELQSVIEDKCATCHMPMAHFTAAAGGDENAVLGEGFADPAHDLHNLAVDGVSCTLCHQILEDGFGETTSFSGGYAIDAELLPGQRENYGPHAVEPGLAQIMRGSSGFMPIQSEHVDLSELCATCHTLYTPYLDADGEIVGEFPEQMAYFEWLASSFWETVACQTCHMPQAKGGVQLSTTGGPPRSPFHQHIFAGGNAYMLDILRTFGDEMAVTASSAQLGDKQQQILDQLQKRTASVDLKEVRVDGSNLVADVSVTTSVGHKFPTGFPSRRAWFHLVVQNASGQTVFESGGVAPDGSIVGNDNDADATAFEPHYTAIDGPGQVQIYESIMGNTEGEVTTTLLRGAEYAKDNRLLPAGFDKGAVGEDIAVRGAAFEDTDFVGGGDRIRYTVDLGETQGPFTVTAELLYQSIGYRWAENLRDFEGQEVDRFTVFYGQVTNQPVIVAVAEAVVGD